MMIEPDNPQRRYTDLSPKDIHDPRAASRIRADAAIGKRKTDPLLGRRFTKADQPQYLLDEEKSFEPNELIISRTDQRGTITYCNDVFSKMSGWSKEELLGSNHNILRHPDMPRVAYKLVWDQIKAGKEFYGYVKNLRKNGGFYWVFAYITADINDSGEVVGYTSYRRFAPKLAVTTMEGIYRHLLEVEKKGGIEAAEVALSDFLTKNGFHSYDQFIVDLQVKANASLN